MAAMIHVRKTHANHTSFLADIYERFEPFMSKGTFVLVTDQEFNFDCIWPSAWHVFCNLHLKVKLGMKYKKFLLKFLAKLYKSSARCESTSGNHGNPNNGI